MLILRAIVNHPWATDNEVGKTLGLPRATVTRARLRMRDAGVLSAGYSFDLDQARPGPVTIVCGRAGSDVADKDLARGLERLLKEHAASGAFIVEGGSFAGAVMEASHGRLPLWSASALSLRAPQGGSYLIHSLDTFPFPRAPGIERRPVDFAPLLEVLTGKARVPGSAPARSAPRRQEGRQLRKSEVSVALSLLEHPELPIAEAARAAGLSRSTFAHVKGALLARGFLQESTWVRLPAIGFQVLLAVALYRRPRRDDKAGADLREMLSQGTAPVARYASSTHEVTFTPFRDLTAARQAVRILSARDRELELLAPPFVAPFLLPQAQSVAHSEPGDLTAAWLKAAF